jgi:glycerol dehydrogenase-like iron-containing ADH family enzyme
MIVSNEIAQGVLGLAVSFWGGRVHRPGWVAACAVLHALTCFLSFLPQLVHGTFPGYGTEVGGKFTERREQ